MVWLIPVASETGATITVSAVAFHPSGGLIVAGNFRGASVSIGGMSGTGPIGRPLEANAFVARLRDDGTAQWLTAWTRPLDEVVMDLEIANDGTIYVSGGLDIPGASLAVPEGPRDAFLATYSPEGVEQSLLVFGDPRLMGGNAPGDYVSAIALRDDGDIDLYGSFEGTMSVGGRTVSSVDGSLDTFLVRLRGTVAQEVWTFGGSLGDWPQGFLVLGSRRFIGIRSYGTLDLGSAGSFESTGADPIPVLAELGADGVPAWARALEGFGGVAFDSGRSELLIGSTRISGETAGGVRLESFTLDGAPGQSRDAPRGTGVTLSDLQFMDDGAIVFTGTFREEMRAGSSRLAVPRWIDSQNGYVSVFDSTDEHRWSNAGISMSGDRRFGAAAISGNRIAVVGTFDRSIAIGETQLGSHPHQGFVAFFDMGAP